MTIFLCAPFPFVAVCFFVFETYIKTEHFEHKYKIIT